jgi:hypothetical protein
MMLPDDNKMVCIVSAGEAAAVGDWPGREAAH